jgi:hypothetical protein
VAPGKREPVTAVADSRLGKATICELRIIGAIHPTAFQNFPIVPIGSLDVLIRPITCRWHYLAFDAVCELHSRLRALGRERAEPSVR